MIGFAASACGATLSIVHWQDLDFEFVSPEDSSISITSCYQADVALAVCGLEIPENGHLGTSTLGDALSKDGSIGGGTGVVGPVFAIFQYSARFSEDVDITGGAGSGTLVAHFDWSADGDQQSSSAEESFSAQAGSALESWRGMWKGGSGKELLNSAGTQDLSTPFTFGQPTVVSGLTEGTSFNNGSLGSDMTVRFSVYDSAGNLLPNVTIAIQDNDEMFLPEPVPPHFCLSAFWRS